MIVRKSQSCMEPLLTRQISSGVLHHCTNHQTLHTGDWSLIASQLWLLSFALSASGKILICHCPPMWFRHAANQG